jgi:hypothetical protein
VVATHGRNALFATQSVIEKHRAAAGDEKNMADALIGKVFENIICDSHF